MRTFVDRGGTFTDIVEVADDGLVRVSKVRSDVAVVGDLSRGQLVFGTTVATNALVERKGVPTLLVVSRGFRDVLDLGDMTRPALFDPDARWPAHLATRVIEVGGRVGGDGRECEPLAIPPLDLTGIESVAIALVHGPSNPAHERAVAAALPPDLPVSLGHEVAPELGYLARVETTLLDAAVTPLLRRALRRDRIAEGALAIRSDGSLVPAPGLRAPDAVLSGPAGGVLAVEAVARQAGFAHAIGLDMGGTSTDVCCVEVDTPRRRASERRVAGVRVRRPVLEVDTIAAGGGSILASDGIRATVGPASAGADPGPQCYGRGGPPTLTDAALVAGLLDPRAFTPALDASRVDLPGPAESFLAVARQEMAAAARRVALARGLDPPAAALVAYGGAAGQHAAEVAALLGIGVVLVHPCASVLSAWGQALARREEAAVRSTWRPFPEGWPGVVDAWRQMAAALPVLGQVVRTVELRHVGTDHPIEVEADDPAAALAAFSREHRQRFGFDRPGHGIEIVCARVRVAAAAAPAPRVDADPWNLGRRMLRGPAVIHTSTTSTWIPAGWTARRHRGLLWIERSERPAPSRQTERTPAGIATWASRLGGVAEESGEVLRRLARSVSVRERLDFSCAVFDGQGDLVANAPHVPVHLGAMGETVRDLLRRRPDAAGGQAWLTNDPAAGGSHLPDLTVVSPAMVGTRRFFVACRAHHVDVGGLVPGSMPPGSRTLADEGHVFRQVPLLALGRFVAPDLRSSRDPATVRADLEAQLAANLAAARALAGLGPAAVLDAWMRHLHDAAAESAAQVLERLDGAAEDVIDGIPLVLRVRGRTFDFGGTGGPHAGNLNAPPAVVRAAVLYALRVLSGADIPMNEGTLRNVEIVVPSPSILSPPPGAAVVGGNVETSQRIVDLVLRAAGYSAASQGTMNNLTFGAEGWSYYETLGGGEGASARGPGASARQVHMTNTRATDVEVLEARAPLRVVRFEIRRGSGGVGMHAGGDGLVREIEALAPLGAALLATRRGRGAPGLCGGGAGMPGVDEVRVSGAWCRWDGRPIALRAGDRVRVSTPGGGGWGTPRADPGAG